MCVVSMIGDHYGDKWTGKPWYDPGVVTLPYVPPHPGGPVSVPNQPSVIITTSEITKKEFDELRREVMEMKDLLKRAIKYDQDNGEPECQIEEKMELLRKVAEMVGISLDDVIGAPKKKVLLTEEKA